MACFQVGRYSARPPSNQSEAEELDVALQLWADLGNDLHPALWSIRQAWTEKRDKAPARTYLGNKIP